MRKERCFVLDPRAPMRWAKEDLFGGGGLKGSVGEIKHKKSGKGIERL